MISRDKQQNNIAGTKGANLEDKFLFYVFAAFSIT